MKLEEKNIIALIDKYLEGRTNEKEEELLLNYYESFQSDVSWDEENLGSIEELKLSGLKRLMTAIDKSSKNKIINLFKPKVLKYAAVIVVIITVSWGYLNADKSEVGIPIVEVESIEQAIIPGSEKAILTLEDGSDVALEKGGKYSSNHSTSNGEKLVYRESSKIASSTEIKYNTLTIPRGGQFFVELSDKTKVWLNSESRLKYPVNFVKGRARMVELEYGEAFFEVTSSKNNDGANFLVKTQSQEIEVVGTAFNVNAYKGTSKIISTLVEGKINLKSDLNPVKKLFPNQQVILDKEQQSLKIKTVDVHYVIAWKEGKFNFKDKPLKDIMKVLRRWYDFEYTFKSEELKKLKFSGIINKNQRIENIFSNISKTNTVKFTMNDKHVIIE